ncbi:MAG: MlaA family lipoprotein [Hyphococcus sp.]
MIAKLFIAALAAGAVVAAEARAQLSDTGEAEDIAEELRRSETDLEDAAAVDPWEGFNRKMFAVNNVIDDALLVPSSKVYRAVTHKKQRKGLRNLLANARTPVILVNDILQGEFKRAGETASRFVINTTIGFGGMGDPAERMGIPQHSEDFGQTLAVWGAPSGPYLFLPFFGPSTIRDGIGAGVDVAASPLTWVRTDPANYARFSRAGATAVALREPLIEPLAEIEASSLDYYASLRSFYMQARKREIANGRTSFEDLPDIGDFEEFDEIE